MSPKTTPSAPTTTARRTTSAPRTWPGVTDRTLRAHELGHASPPPVLDLGPAATAVTGVSLNLVRGRPVLQVATCRDSRHSGQLGDFAGRDRSGRPPNHLGDLPEGLVAHSFGQVHRSG